jgi:hypothetical protein
MGGGFMAGQVVADLKYVNPLRHRALLVGRITSAIETTPDVLARRRAE